MTIIISVALVASILFYSIYKLYKLTDKYIDLQNKLNEDHENRIRHLTGEIIDLHKLLKNKNQ